MVVKWLKQLTGGKRRFAYEIEKYREGSYHIMTFTAEDAAAVNEFARLSKIDDSVSVFNDRQVRQVVTS